MGEIRMTGNTDKEKSKEILRSIEDKLRADFASIRDVIFNPNVKGYEYELKVKEFFEPYFGGLYDFHVRCSLLDTELKAFSLFSPGENEFDVVATHKSAIPRMVLKTGASAFIPYDAVAFIVSVKQTLSLQALERDLVKYQKVSQLPFSSPGISITGGFTINRPVRVLLYYEGSLSDNISRKLSEMTQVWDIFENISENIFIANVNLPFTKALAKDVPYVLYRKHSLPMLMLFLSASLPVPPALNTGMLLLNLLRMGEAP